MTWNIFKRVAALEEKVKDLTDFNSDNNRWIGRLQEKVRHIEDKLFMQAIESKAFPADKARENKRQYHREWYAKRRVELKKARSTKEQKEKRAAYARAYYLRKKGEKNA